MYVLYGGLHVFNACIVWGPCNCKMHKKWPLSLKIRKNGPCSLTRKGRTQIKYLLYIYCKMSRVSELILVQSVNLKHCWQKHWGSNPSLFFFFLPFFNQLRTTVSSTIQHFKTSFRRFCVSVCFFSALSVLSVLSVPTGATANCKFVAQHTLQNS